MIDTILPLDEGSRLARAKDIFCAEWIKLWSLRSTYWVLLGASATAIAIGVSIANADVSQWPTMSPQQRAAFDPLTDPYVGFMFAQLVFAVLGVLTVTSEYSSGLIRTTFTAAPARRAVLAAKVAVVVAVTVPVSAVTSLATFGIGQAVLSRRHIGIAITHPGAPRAITAAALYLVMAALIGVALGALIRHTAGAIGALVSLLFLAPDLLHGSAQWMVDLEKSLPGTAIRRLVSQHADQLAPSILQAFVVITAYPVALLIAAMILINRRDA